MTDHSKPFLVLLLFAQFVSDAEKEAFENLLRAARVTYDGGSLRVLGAEAAHRPPVLHQTWIRVQLDAWNGQTILFIWNRRGDSGGGAASRLQTLELFVPAVTRMKRILVVRERDWKKFEQEAEGPDALPFLLLREKSVYGLPDAEALGAYLGTYRRSHSQSFRAVQTGETIPPPRPLRNDEPTQSVATERARSLATTPVATPKAEVAGWRNPDPEDERPTIEPPPPLPPRSPKR